MTTIASLRWWKKGTSNLPALPENAVLKYLHVRRINEFDEIQPHGGVTVAYCVTDVEGMSHIYVNFTKCRDTELFCYKTGRDIARKRMEEDGPAEILDLTHPISEEIADWIGSCLWPGGCEVLGYKGDDMGFAIDLFKDDKLRWLSTFESSQFQTSYLEE